MGKNGIEFRRRQHNMEGSAEEAVAAVPYAKQREEHLINTKTIKCLKLSSNESAKSLHNLLLLLDTRRRQQQL